MRSREPGALPTIAARGRYDARIEVRGSGPPLVLVPGMDGTGLLFYRQTPLLARDHRVGTYALRDDATRMEDHVADLALVVRAVSNAGAPALLVGESFGGAVALSFALAHPELASGLVIVNSFPRFLPQGRLRLAIGGVRLVPWDAMTMVRRLTASRLHSRFTHRSEIRRFLELTRRTTREGYLSRLRILREYDVRDRLASIPQPVLLLAADRDHLVPSVEQARYMAARLPNATLRVLPGHGHICLIAPNIDLGAILRDWGLPRPRP